MKPNGNALTLTVCRRENTYFQKPLFQWNAGTQTTKHIWLIIHLNVIAPPLTPPHPTPPHPIPDTASIDMYNIYHKAYLLTCLCSVATCPAEYHRPALASALPLRFCGFVPRNFRWGKNEPSPCAGSSALKYSYRLISPPYGMEHIQLWSETT